MFGLELSVISLLIFFLVFFNSIFKSNGQQWTRNLKIKTGRSAQEIPEALELLTLVWRVTGLNAVCLGDHLEQLVFSFLFFDQSILCGRHQPGLLCSPGSNSAPLLL